MTTPTPTPAIAQAVEIRWDRDAYVVLLDNLIIARCSNKLLAESFKEQFIARLTTLVQSQVAAALEERDQYKKLWEIRGKALARPCMNCGYEQKQIKHLTRTKGEGDG